MVDPTMVNITNGRCGRRFKPATLSRVVVSRKHFLKIFNNFEASASEWLENPKEMFALEMEINV